MHLPVVNNPADPPGPPLAGSAHSLMPEGAIAPDAPPEALASPQALIAWSLTRFDQQRLVITTGFGLEGCAMIDMLVRIRASQTLTVHYLDTHFLFRETLALRDALLARYPTLRLINAGTDLTPEQQELAHGPELWRSAPDRCCDLRKVQPMRALLRGAQAWMTAIRKTQADTRSGALPVSIDGLFGVIKINPLLEWSRQQVWDYVRQHDVPYNALHDQGYPSIGCTHCTRPVIGTTPADYSREGRWSGTGKTECGLHWNTPAGAPGPTPPSTDRTEELS